MCHALLLLLCWESWGAGSHSQIEVSPSTACGCSPARKDCGQVGRRVQERVESSKQRCGEGDAAAAAQETLSSLTRRRHCAARSEPTATSVPSATLSGRRGPANISNVEISAATTSAPACRLRAAAVPSTAKQHSSTVTGAAVAGAGRSRSGIMVVQAIFTQID